MKALVSLNIAVLFALLLSACSTTNLPPLEESIAAGYFTVETLAESVLAASNAGAISDADRALAKLTLQQAKDCLDLAAGLSANQRPNEAMDQVNQVFTYLEVVRRLIGVTN